MKEVPEGYEELKKVSESKNPYAPECPNRHLWSEGFRSGVKFAESFK